MAVDTGTSVTAWAVFSAIGGSVIGSLVGGAINYYLQAKQRSIQRRATAFSMLVKLVKITSNIKNLGKSIQDDIDGAKDASGLEPWQLVLPVTNLPEPVRFSSDELALLLDLDNGLFNRIADLDELHQAVVSLFSGYAKLRLEVQAKVGGAEMEGRAGTSRVSEEIRLWMGPKRVEMNDIIGAMIRFTKNDGDAAVKGLFDFQKLISKKLGVTKSMAMKDGSAPDTATGKP